MDLLKKLGKIIFAFFVISTLFGFKMQDSKPIKSIDYVVFVKEVTNSFIKQIEKEYGFRCCGSGGSMPFDIMSITIKLISHKIVTMDEARELEVNLIEKFLKIINSHEKIRPYLREYPFPASRADIMISFRNKNNRRQPEGISLIFQARNQIFYEVNDSKTDRLVNVGEESYDEALKIVQEKQKNSNSQF